MKKYLLLLVLVSVYVSAEQPSKILLPNSRESVSSSDVVTSGKKDFHMLCLDHCADTCGVVSLASLGAYVGSVLTREDVVTNDTMLHIATIGCWGGALGVMAFKMCGACYESQMHRHSASSRAITSPPSSSSMHYQAGATIHPIGEDV